MVAMVVKGGIEQVAERGSRRLRESGVFRIARPVVGEASTDVELVEGMLADYPGAWREFQRRFDRLVHRCITRVTRRFSTVVAHEDVREIYATFVLSLLANDRSKLRSFDPERGNRFSSWIGMLAINAAYDYLRSIRREPARGTLAEAADLASEIPDPFQLTSEHELARVAEKALSSFSARDREFATLYFAEGMDPADIARSLNISVKTVYSKKHKIQARLESALSGRADESDPHAATDEDEVIAA